MSKYVKNLVVKDIILRLEGVQDALLVNVVGLDANSTMALRRQLRQKDIHLLVVKNGLAKRAAEGTPLAAAFEGAEGTLAMVDNQINQNTATARFKAVLPNPTHALWPNQFVKARLRVATRHGALVVPASAIQHGPKGTFVYVVGADTTAAVRPVTVDAMVGLDAVLLPDAPTGTGLHAGEQVVVDGQSRLKPGAKVVPKTGDEPGRGKPGAGKGRP